MAFAAFREVVLDDFHLAMHLRRFPDRRDFAAQVLVAGGARGAGFDEAAVSTALRDGEALWQAWGADAPVTSSIDRLFGWTPCRAAFRDGSARVDWCHLGDRRPIEPLFSETVALAMRAPFNLAFGQRTPVEVLEALPPGLPVGGFVFHMSRCGATLVSQLLAAFDCNTALSEAQPLSAALRAASAGPAAPEEAVRWFSGLVNAYAQQRFTYEQRLFVTFAAADVLDIATARRAFPDVPWIFVTRDPAEILAAQDAAADPDFRPGAIAPQRLGVTADQVQAMEPAAYRATMLAALGRAALDAHAGGGGLIVDHSELPDALWTRIFPHFGLKPDAGAIDAMRALSQRYGEALGMPFATGEGPSAAAAPLRPVAERIVGLAMAALRSVGAALPETS